MSDSQYQVSPDQLDTLAKRWQAQAAQLEQISQRIHGLAGQFQAAELRTLITKGLLDAVVLAAAEGKVGQAGTRAADTATALGQDTTGIHQCAANYREAESQAKQHLHRNGHHVPPVKSPGHHPGGNTGHKPTHGPGHHPDTPKPPHPHPQPDPAPKPQPQPSQQGKISLDAVTYNGIFQYHSGPSAMEQYINQALDIMGITDPTARANWMRGLMTIASRETSYNATHVNTDDPNSKEGPVVGDGHRQGCSRGAFQVIPSQFARYHQPGTSNDIYDPVANCCAAMNYVMYDNDRHYRGMVYHVNKDGSNLADRVKQADPNWTTGAWY